MSHSAWVALVIGSSVGGALPMLWGGGLLASTLCAALGAFAAVWANYRLGN